MSQYLYRKNFSKYFLHSISFAIPAIVVGLIIDNIFTKLQRTYSSQNYIDSKIYKLLFGICQLLFIIFVSSIIEMFINKNYATEWQGTTPGLFWAAYYFGTQTNMISNFADILRF